MFYVVPANVDVLSAFQTGQYSTYENLRVAQDVADHWKISSKRNYNIVSVHTVYTTTTIDEAVLEDRVATSSRT
jgi:hypothetical protein